MVDIISVHVQKTAGTAFGKVLQQVYGSERILFDYEHADQPADFVLQQGLIKPEIQVIHGHFPARKYRELFPDARFVVWLRNPIYRFISAYFFLKNYKDNFFSETHRYIVQENLNPLEVAELPEMQNIVARFFFKGVALAEMDFVGVQEFYGEDLAELGDKAGWTEFKNNVENINQHPNYCENVQVILNDSGLVKKLALLNSEDMELYQEALSLRAKRRQESLSLQYTLAGFGQSQFLLYHLQNQIRQLQDKQRQLEVLLKESQKPAQKLEVIRLKSQQLSERLLGFSIDLPALVQLDSDAISVKGWAIGDPVKAVALRVLCNGQLLTETPINLHRPDVAKVYPVDGAEHSGFFTRVFIAGLRTGAEMLLQVLLADQNSVDIGVIRPL